MILMLVGYTRITARQPGESVTVPGLALKKANRETLPNKNTIEEKPINNTDPYKKRMPTVGGYTYPVIFEPIQNVEFSRSVYRITSVVDFSPHVEFFQKYDQYITRLYRDLRKKKKLN